MTGLPLKLAVASKDGISINEHFGHAKVFHINSVSENQCLLLEQRQVEHYCHGNSGNQSAMAMILQTISDCHGDGPAEKLAAIGVQAISDYAYEAVEASLLDYVRIRAKKEMEKADMNIKERG